MDEQDFTVKRGNSFRMVGWAFPASINLAGSDMVLTIVSAGRPIITKSSQFEGLDIEADTIDGEPVTVVYWTPTENESRQIPPGRMATYKLTRRITGGEVRDYVEGYVIGDD